jgi:hypothetical protein
VLSNLLQKLLITWSNQLKIPLQKRQCEWIDIAQSNVVPERNTQVITSYDWETRDIPDGYYEAEAIAYDAEEMPALKTPCI